MAHDMRQQVVPFEAVPKDLRVRQLCQRGVAGLPGGNPEGRPEVLRWVVLEGRAGWDHKQSVKMDG